MKVRAKFRCFAVQHAQGLPPDQVAANVILQPVYSDSPENATWSKYTPNGSINMTITNPDAIAQFEPGKSYYIDFTEADE